jgi:hypothetical protein
MTNDPMTAAGPLNEAQRRRLSALLDTILPASEDSRMPSAAELDFNAYLAEQAGDFLAALPGIVDLFDDAFAKQTLPRRVAAVEAFAKDDVPAFNGLLMRVYDCYYQDDRVRELIGAEPGPPFPRGNVIPAGDLSGLDAVVKSSPGYRR